MPIFLKRVYDPPTATDGVRLLVERLWPRGVSKEKAAIDHWLKDIAPSADLRRWFGHAPDRWPEFQTRYSAELDGNIAAVQALRELYAAGPVTFVFVAKDTERNGALALKNYLEGRLAD